MLAGDSILSALSQILTKRWHHQVVTQWLIQILPFIHRGKAYFLRMKVDESNTQHFNNIWSFVCLYAYRDVFGVAFLNVTLDTFFVIYFTRECSGRGVPHNLWSQLHAKRWDPKTWTGIVPHRISGLVKSRTMGSCPRTPKWSADLEFGHLTLWRQTPNPFGHCYCHYVNVWIIDGIAIVSHRSLFVATQGVGFHEVLATKFGPFYLIENNYLIPYPTEASFHCGKVLMGNDHSCFMRACISIRRSCRDAYVFSVPSHLLTQFFPFQMAVLNSPSDFRVHLLHLVSQEALSEIDMNAPESDGRVQAIAKVTPFSWFVNWPLVCLAVGWHLNVT